MWRLANPAACPACICKMSLPLVDAEPLCAPGAPETPASGFTVAATAAAGKVCMYAIQCAAPEQDGEDADGEEFEEANEAARWRDAQLALGRLEYAIRLCKLEVIPSEARMNMRLSTFDRLLAWLHALHAGLHSLLTSSCN